MISTEPSLPAQTDSNRRAPVCLRDPLGDSKWDLDVARCPGASFYHTSAWCRVLHDTYGYTPYYFYAGWPDQPVAVLPTMEVHSRLTGRRGISLPFSDNCDPAASDPLAYQDLYLQAELFGQERDWRYLECRGVEAYCPTENVSIRYYGHQVPLSTDERVLFQSFDSAVRRAIRKAERSDLTVELTGDFSAVRDFYQLLSRTRRRHGLPPQPFRFFENLHRHVLQPGHGLIVLVRVGQQAVAGAVFLMRARNVIMKFAASDHRFLALRINNLALWEAMRHFGNAGCVSMDLGRTSLWNQGLRGYKRRWGAIEHEIHYQRFDFRKRHFVTSGDVSRGAPGLFRYLPLPITQMAGALLYRHIA